MWVYLTAASCTHPLSSVSALCCFVLCLDLTVVPLDTLNTVPIHLLTRLAAAPHLLHLVPSTYTPGL